MFLHGILTAAIRGTKPDRAPARPNRVWAGIPDVRNELFGARPLSYRAIPIRRQR